MGVQHIMNSRTTEFTQPIMALTSGDGVDVVLNSLTSEGFVAASLSTLRTRGQFIEIAKRGVWSSEQMAQTRPDVAYAIVDMMQTSQNQPELTHALLHNIKEKFQEGQWQTPLMKVFSMEQVVDAFRYMQRAEHMGKIVTVSYTHLTLPTTSRV